MLLEVIDSQDGIETRHSEGWPRIWAMTEGRVGDDRQVIALARAIGGCVQEVQVRESLREILLGRLLNSFGLHAPWHARLCADRPLPEVMIAAGGRCVALSRWIRKVSRGRTRIVMIGRPWAPLADFDLVVTTPQYDLPMRGNVQLNLLPLNAFQLDPEDDCVAAWAERFATLPGPWTGVLLGGDSGSFRFTRSCARRLARRLNEIGARTGGALLITTSARTPRRAIDILQRELTAPHLLHVWQPGQSANPLTAILASAGRLVVTGESASMIAEAINTGKPVELFHLRERRMSRALTELPRRVRLGWLVRLGPRLGYWTPPRNMRRLHALLAERGLLHAADGASARYSDLRIVDRDLARVAARIHRLLAARARNDAEAIDLTPFLTHPSA